MACARVSSIFSPAGRGWACLCPLPIGTITRAAGSAARATPLQNGESARSAAAAARRGKRRPRSSMFKTSSLRGVSTPIRYENTAEKFPPPGGSGSWQAKRRSDFPGSIRSFGLCSWHVSPARGQRGWNGHRAGGWRPTAGSPAVLRRRKASGSPRPAEAGPRGEEQGRVGVPGRAEDLVRRSLLDDPAEVHDRGPVGQVFHDAEIVPDEEVRGPRRGRLLELEEEVENLRTNGNVERGDRFVENDELRLRGQSPGDGDPLALSARELPGATLCSLRGKADRVEQGEDALTTLGRAPDAVNGERLADDGRDVHPRVERAARVLEDDADVAARPVQRGKRQ